MVGWRRLWVVVMTVGAAEVSVVDGWVGRASPGGEAERLWQAEQRGAGAGRGDASDRVREWIRPRSEERRGERLEMVGEQIRARGVTNGAVLAAMSDVPRHWFVPESVRESAYADRPLPIGEGQTISQPYIVALMTAALKLTNESRVLEIGTGSGYQAAVLAEITPHVYTIEIVEPLGRRAMQTFKDRGYDTIAAKVGDGYQGWTEKGPFDAIIVTCAPDHVPGQLVEQLKVGGRICIPVGEEGGVQWLRLLTKKDNGELESRDLEAVRFVPMTGAAEEKR